MLGAVVGTRDRLVVLSPVGVGCLRDCPALWSAVATWITWFEQHLTHRLDRAERSLVLVADGAGQPERERLVEKVYVVGVVQMEPLLLRKTATSLVEDRSTSTGVSTFRWSVFS